MTRRILTIDGGGLRGVFAAAVIEQMERINGKSACEIFDCFCGTSAGALIAGGLAAGRSATEIKELFLSWGRRINRLRGAGGDPAKLQRESVRVLDQLLKERLFGPELRPSELRRWVAMPARNMELGEVVFFGNFPLDLDDPSSFWAPRPGIDRDEPMWRIVRRSAALPPMFPPDGPYLDGGVSPFANPCFAACVGVQRCLGWNPYREALCFYSVGTGYHRTRVAEPGKLEPAALYDAMVGAMMQDINFLQHQVMKHYQADETVRYRRYNLSFDAAGFEEFGLTVPSDEELRELAQTASPLLERLAALGTAIGQQSVVESDFRDRPPAPDRRSGADRRVGAERRTTRRQTIPDQRSSAPRRRHQRRAHAMEPLPSDPRAAAAMLSARRRNRKARD